MSPSLRRILIVVASGMALAASSAVVPVQMAWSAPAMQYAEIDVPLERRVAMPFGGSVLASRPSAALPFAASHLGVRWNGSDDAVVEVRTATGPAAWGPWRQVDVAHDLGHHERRDVLSGLVRADGARLVQARGRGDAHRLRLVAIDTVGGPRHLVRTGPPAAKAAVAQPGVVSRAQWGADESMRRGTPAHAPISRMVVHHTVTPNDDPDPASTMRAMYAYHVKANGWDDLGYNFVVDSAGRVYEGRWAGGHGPGQVPTGESADGRGVVGAHSEGENHGSVGISLMGNFTDRAPAPAAVESLQRLLAWKADRHGIDPVGTTTWARGRALPTIAGHRDVGSTACPGDRLLEKLPSIREAAAGLVGNAAATKGYWALGRDGRVLAFGEALAPLGDVGPPLTGPVTAMAATPSGRGYWVLGQGGRVVPFGDAVPLGSPELLGVVEPPGRSVSIEATPSGLGYWVATEAGRVRAFGDAPDLGSVPGGPVVDMARTASGRGYWVVTASGQVHAFGDAPHHGSATGRSGEPIVALAPAPAGLGYWLVSANGSVFAFGNARRLGGLPERRITARVVDARPSASGRGYYLVAGDGAVFALGDAAFHGAATGLPGGAAGMAVLP